MPEPRDRGSEAGRFGYASTAAPTPRRAEADATTAGGNVNATARPNDEPANSATRHWPKRCTTTHVLDPGTAAARQDVGSALMLPTLRAAARCNRRGVVRGREYRGRPGDCPPRLAAPIRLPVAPEPLGRIASVAQRSSHHPEAAVAHVGRSSPPDRPCHAARTVRPRGPARRFAAEAWGRWPQHTQNGPPSVAGRKREPSSAIPSPGAPLGSPTPAHHPYLVQRDATPKVGASPVSWRIAIGKAGCGGTSHAFGSCAYSGGRSLSPGQPGERERASPHGYR